MSMKEAQIPEKYTTIKLFMVVVLGKWLCKLSPRSYTVYKTKTLDSGNMKFTIFSSNYYPRDPSQATWLSVLLFYPFIIGNITYLIFWFTLSNIKCFSLAMSLTESEHWLCLQKTQVWFPVLALWFQPYVTQVPWDQTLSSGFRGTRLTSGTQTYM